MCINPEALNRLRQISDYILQANDYLANHRHRNAERLVRASLNLIDPPCCKQFKSFRVPLLIKLAESIRLQGRYQDAELTLCTVFDDCEWSNEKDELNKGAALNALGVIYKYQGKLVEAKHCFLQAIRIYRRIDKVNADAVGTVLYNLAGLSHACGEYRRGFRFARRALRLVRGAETFNHLALANIMSCLAANLQGMGLYRKASWYYWISIKILLEEFGPIHRDVAINLNNLATIALIKRRLASATTLLEWSLKIKLNLLPSNHPEFGAAFLNAGHLYQQSDRFDKARACYKKALQVFGVAFEQNHPSVQAAQRQIAQLAICNQVES